MMRRLHVVTLLAFAARVTCIFQGRAGPSASLLGAAAVDHPGHGAAEEHHHEPIITKGEEHHGGEHEPTHKHDDAASHDAGHAEHAHEHAHGHASAHAEHGDGGCNSSANSVAVGLLTSVVLIPIVVYMTMSKAAHGAVSDLTFRMVDLSISIFLAVLWFSASADILASEVFSGMFPHAEEVFAITQVIILYAVAMVVAYLFRDNKYYLLTFSGCAAHYIAFAGIRAVGETQHIMSTKMVDKDHGAYVSFMFCMLLFLVCGGISLICFFAWRRNVKSDELQIAVEDLELDIIGIVVSFAIMQALRHALTGRYPPQAHMLLLEQSDRNDLDFLGSRPHIHPKTHTMEQRMFMLAWSIALLIISFFSMRYLEAIKERSEYWIHKIIHVVQVVLVMCVAWGFLLWGEWEFYETIFKGDPMFGKMVFAIIATFCCLLIITALAYATDERFSNAKGYADLCIMAVSLVAAWSWEHCFHTAINVVAVQYQVGYGGVIPKIIIALLIPLVILPGYVIFLKPIVVGIDEKLNEGEHHKVVGYLRRDPTGQEGEEASPDPASAAETGAVDTSGGKDLPVGQ